MQLTSARDPEAVPLNTRHGRWTVNWLEPSQENFYFKEDIVSMNQCRIGGISGRNVNIYWRLIKHWSQFFGLYGKTTKLREAALWYYRERNTFPAPRSFTLPLPQPPAPTHPSVHRTVTITQCPHRVSVLHSMIALEKMPGKHISFCTCVWSSSLPHYHPYLKPPRALKSCLLTS